MLQNFDYVFAENGLVAYKQGELLAVESLKKKLGNTKINEFVKFTLRLITELEIPVMRGTFIEFRNGMFNVSPIGRNCSQEEREEFEKYDKEHKVRATMIERLSERFPDWGLKYSIGGQISFDVFPNGWDKTFCLQFITNDFSEIHFFGDKTFPGGNDYEIFSHPAVTGHSVTSPQHTLQLVREVFYDAQRLTSFMCCV